MATFVQPPVQTIMHIMQNSAASGYIGEPVTQLEHALQAAHAARQAGERKYMIVAALLHDIGHQLVHVDTHGADLQVHDTLGVINHAQAGAKFLEQLGMPPIVCRPIALHADAKRYLAHDPGYYAKLSDASKRTLALQGSIMTEAERADWATREAPYSTLALRLRTYDEAAKQSCPSDPIPGLHTYEQLIQECMNL